MSAPKVLVRPAHRSVLRDIPGSAVWLAAGTLLLGAIFHQEVTAAIAVWSTSTAYNHCFLVLPIAAYLLWDRRESLRGLRAEPVPLVALAGIPVALIWLAADRLGIMEGRQFAAMTFLELLFLAVLGWRFAWAVAGPLLYLYFLVPFGATITPQLQDFTTGFVQVGLNLLHVPVYIDGYTIEIPQGSFFIAEACAGLRFLIASLAFGALYALVMYRSPVRRGLFLLVSLIVPIIANGFRALGIVLLATVLGSAKAAATDHVLYGWLFFSIVTLLLIAIGLPFREDQPEPRGPVQAKPVLPAPAAPPIWRSVLAASAVCLVATLSPAAAIALEPRSGPMPGPVTALNFGPACTSAPAQDAMIPAAPGIATRSLNCDGLPIVVRISLLSPHVTAAPLFRLERTMIERMDSEQGFQSTWIPEASGHRGSWRLLQEYDRSKIMAVAMWIDGKATQPGMADRISMAWSSIVGAPVGPVVMTATPEVNWSLLDADQRSQTLKRFIRVLQNWHGMTAAVTHIAERN